MQPERHNGLGVRCIERQAAKGRPDPGWPDRAPVRVPAGPAAAPRGGPVRPPAPGAHPRTTPPDRGRCRGGRGPWREPCRQRSRTPCWRATPASRWRSRSSTLQPPPSPDHPRGSAPACADYRPRGRGSSPRRAWGRRLGDRPGAAGAGTCRVDHGLGDRGALLGAVCGVAVGRCAGWDPPAGRDRRAVLRYGPGDRIPPPGCGGAAVPGLIGRARQVRQPSRSRPATSGAAPPQCGQTTGAKAPTGRSQTRSCA